jgi:hypothetical protein
VPPWDDDVPLQENLAPFPGAQVQITIPERAAERTGDRAADRGSVAVAGRGSAS